MFAETSIAKANEMRAISTDRKPISPLDSSALNPPNAEMNRIITRNAASPAIPARTSSNTLIPKNAEAEPIARRNIAVAHVLLEKNLIIALYSYVGQPTA